VKPETRHELKTAIREAIREEASFLPHWTDTLPPLHDNGAEEEVLAAMLRGHIAKPFRGLCAHHFFSDSHKSVFAHAHLEWERLKPNLTPNLIFWYVQLLKDRAPSPRDVLESRADRIIELAAARKLSNLIRRLDIELHHQTIHTCDAEHELQEYLLRQQSE
jgi:hypothetical protein